MGIAIIRSTGLKKYAPQLLLLAAPIIWGFGFTAQKLSADIPSFTLVTLRCVFAALFLLLAIPCFDAAKKTGRRLFSKKKPIDLTRSELVGGILCGAALAAASAFQQFGIAGGTDAGKAAFITALYIVVVPVYGIFIGRRAPFNAWLGVLIAVIGFYLLCINGEFKIAPSDLLVFISALLFALHIVVIDVFSPRCDALRTSCVQFVVAALINAICALIFEAPIELSAIAEAIPYVVYLGVGSSGIAYTVQIIAQKHIAPTAASTILALEAVFGVICSALVLSERMLPREYIGCLIVFAAVLLSQIDFGALRAARRRRKDGENDENVGEKAAKK